MATISEKFHKNPLKTIGGVAETRTSGDKMAKTDKGPGKKRSSVTSVYYAQRQVMGTITGKFHQNPFKIVGGAAETRLTAENLLKGHNSGKNQLSMTSIKYAHLQAMGTITAKFHQNPLTTVGGIAETRLCPQTDGLTDCMKPCNLTPSCQLWAKTL